MKKKKCADEPETLFAGPFCHSMLLFWGLLFLVSCGGSLCRRSWCCVGELSCPTRLWSLPVTYPISSQAWSSPSLFCSFFRSTDTKEEGKPSHSHSLTQFSLPHNTGHGPICRPLPVTHPSWTRTHGTFLGESTFFTPSSPASRPPSPLW